MTQIKEIRLKPIGYVQRKTDFELKGVSGDACFVFVT